MSLWPFATCCVAAGTFNELCLEYRIYEYANESHRVKAHRRYLAVRRWNFSLLDYQRGKSAVLTLMTWAGRPEPTR